MKRIKILTSLTAILCMIAIIGGCGATTEKWAYIHEPTKAVIALSTNGKATYKGNEYSYTEDGDYIILRNKEGDQQSLRYVMDGDKMTLYEESTYERKGEGDGVVGSWRQDNGWSYEFTEDGRFSEDAIFSGHYAIDEEKSCIKFMYDDPIEDAYLYYSLEGDELTVAYPWPMVKVK